MKAYCWIYVILLIFYLMAWASAKEYRTDANQGSTILISLIITYPVICFFITSIVVFIRENKEDGISIGGFFKITFGSFFLWLIAITFANMGVMGFESVLPGKKSTEYAYVHQIGTPKETTIGTGRGSYKATLCPVTVLYENGDTLKLSVYEESLERVQKDKRLTLVNKTGVFGNEYMYIDGINVHMYDPGDHYKKEESI